MPLVAILFHEHNVVTGLKKNQLSTHHFPSSVFDK